MDILKLFESIELTLIFIYAPIILIWFLRLTGIWIITFGMAVGWVIHTIWLGFLWKNSGLDFPVWVSFGKSEISSAWWLVTVFLYLTFRYKSFYSRSWNNLGACYLFLVVLFLLLIFFIPNLFVKFSGLAYYSSWLGWQVIFSELGYAFFFLGGVSTILHLINQRQKIDIWTYAIVYHGIPFMVLSLLLRSVWQFNLSGRYWNWSYEEVLDLVILLIFVIYILLKNMEKPSKADWQTAVIPGMGVILIFYIYGSKWLGNF